ncbi:MAG: diacylglycerol kinase (ATP), partial [Candidatus Aldehydirespiratoraceae bacterium]
PEQAVTRYWTGCVYRSDMAPIQLLSNPTARGGEVQIREVVDAFARRGFEATVIEARTVADAHAGARSAVNEGSARLVAVGGDGVVHIAVNAVAQSETVLGVVPLGTGNDFARALGLLGGDIETQVEHALAEPVAVDAIRTDHGWVATVATLGFSGDVTARANDLGWPRGQSRYTLATLLQLPRLRTMAVSVNVDGRRVGGDTTLLAVGNTMFFGGGMRICPDARPDDGQLQVVNIGDVPRRTFLRVFPRVFSGRHVERSEVSTASGSSVTIDGANVEVWADGEPLGPLPLRLDIIPGALRVARCADVKQ